MPTISVIVPVYKVELYLNRCVDSILGQTFIDFELILVDDGSPDNCPDICDEYAGNDCRVHVIHQENGGLSAARNAGIDWVFANSDSQWISFVDSDDWVHPMYLFTLLSAVKTTNTSVSVCFYKETDGKEVIVAKDNLIAEKWSSEKFYIEKNVNATVAWGKLYSQSHFEHIRYPIGKIHEDEFVTYRILLEAVEVAIITEPLYAYFINCSGITSHWNPRRLDSLMAIQEQITYMKRNGYREGGNALSESIL